MSTAPKLQSARVLDAERRARDYWSIDGLPQIVDGASLILLGVSLWYFFAWSISNFVVGSILLLALIAISLCGRKTVQWLKARFTYPRTGYVPLPPPPRPEYDGAFPSYPITELHINTPNRDTPSDIRRARLSWFRTNVFSVSLSAIWLLLWIIRTPWVCLFATLLFSFAFWFVAHKKMSAPWIILVGLPLVGLAMSVLAVERKHRFAELMVGLGILVILDGAFMFVRYLVRNPVAGT